MNRTTFNMMTCGLLAAVCAGLSSCDDEVPAVGGENPQTIYVTFRLATRGTAGKRAPTLRTVPPDGTGDGSWGGGYEQSGSVGFEDKILGDGLHVTFYDAADGSYAGRLENIVCIPPGEDYVREIYAELRLDNLETTLEELQLHQKKLKMMVMANMPDVTDDDDALKAGLSSEADGPGSLTYRYIGQSEEDFPAIPMWGVCSPDLSAITPGKRLDLGNVELLRAMAKVEVGVDKGNEALAKLDVKVKSVTLNKVNKSGYGLPGKWNEKGNTTDLKFDETLRVPPGVETVQDTVFGKADADGSVVFYLPECENGNEAGEEGLTMTVTYTVEGEERQGTIHFCPYSDGHPAVDTKDPAGRWDIVRNHHYQYMISGIDVIKFTTNVHPWDDGGEHEIDMK